MSKLWGDVFQLAFVVDDLEAQLAHWTGTMGVGPFYRFGLPLALEWLEMKGERVDPAADIFGGVAVAYSGDMMIELIQPGTAPSIYRDFLDAGRSGLHHLGSFTDDLDRTLAAAQARGIGVAMAGQLPLSRFAYFDTDAHGQGTMMEVIEPQQSMIDLFDRIRLAARDWDGSDPVREM
ncbi:catechol 2,3-dioxygenase-like lactoylglutathione lyase family enzyme [Sphingomonas jejuensis]|uniref:Catechol 2,3-dioxygenase-like lactoylglutathione lyase family enzyme n=1 Tax=Sphingomonas jejuensis TaxID=904715 RepID=A0ABX0XHU7_9SPHN|nr:VOC family protein [Sphingomonas jejuensis]NJC32913.1 catechol 2,3-dioxygenase-like lactoylglutathione lyase family enzyme [Sphingomonas jejuensis]